MSALGCPRCNTALGVANTRTAALHGCSACGGIWLDTATSQRLCHALEADAHALIDGATRAATRTVDTVRAVHCPVCGAPLARTRIANAGVDIDVCAEHGTWFDRDELPRIAQSAAVARAYGRAAPAVPAPAASNVPREEGSKAVEIAGEVGFGVLLGVLEGLLDF